MDETTIPGRPVVSQRLAGDESGPWLTRKSVLFRLGSLLILVGILLTIYFRSRTYLSLGVFGLFFLCGLFFWCFWSASRKDNPILLQPVRTRTQASHPEEMLFFGHSPWIFDRPLLCFTGLLFIFGGVAIALFTGDLYFLLLSVFGMVFMMQVWSFWQLNSFTMTTERAIFQQAYPSNASLVIPREQVTGLAFDQNFVQRVSGVCTLVIQTLDEDIRVKLKHPKAVLKLIDRYA